MKPKTTNCHFSRTDLFTEYIWQGGAWQVVSVTRYIYAGGLAVQERDGNNLPRISYTRGSDRGGGIDGLLARTDHAAQLHAYYHHDGCGNITAILNSAQFILARYLYDPYGNTIAASGPLAEANTYRFASKEIHVASGLIYFGFRFYSPALQRWLNADPIQESGGMNLFAYVANSPIGGIDAWGHAELSKLYQGDDLGGNGISSSAFGRGPMPYYGVLWGVTDLTSAGTWDSYGSGAVDAYMSQQAAAQARQYSWMLNFALMLGATGAGKEDASAGTASPDTSPNNTFLGIGTLQPGQSPFISGPASYYYGNNFLSDLAAGGLNLFAAAENAISQASSTFCSLAGLASEQLSSDPGMQDLLQRSMVIAPMILLPEAAAAEETAAGDVSAATPIGRSGNPINVVPGANEPATINGIDYSAHALDQMQGRGIMPSVVENTLNTGTQLPGNLPGTSVFYDSVNDVRVVVNSTTGKVITVIPGKP